MGIIRTQVILHHDSNLPEDRMVNVLHWLVNEPYTGDKAQAIVDAIRLAYGHVDAHLSGFIAPNADIVHYNLAHAEPRTPVREDGLALTVGAETVLPGEVALCVSFQAQGTSGEPQARRRGRVYLGPFNTGVLVTGSMDGRPSSTLVGNAVSFGEELLAVDHIDVAWAVYSPTDDIARPVDNGWVDDAFDTQRRRGLRATARTTF
jgi:hypothetical protein